MQPTISMNKHTTISTPVSEYDDDEIVNPSNNPHIDGMLSALLPIWAELRGARKPQGLYARMDDGADGIRRSLKLVDELDRFERE